MRINENRRFYIDQATRGATLLLEHERNPFCYICNLFFAPDYMPVHLKVDHTKEELATHLLLAYFDEWLEQEEEIEKAVTTGR